MRWLGTSVTFLWPYALRQVQHSLNHTPRLTDKRKRSPAQIWYSTDVSANPIHSIPFGCPAFVLHDDIQRGQKTNKWNDKARVGIYLGRSPRHARNVALILNTQTGLVSPQFHVEYDKRFETVHQMKGIEHLWMFKAGLMEPKKSPRKRSKRDADGNPKERREHVDFQNNQPQREGTHGRRTRTSESARPPQIYPDETGIPNLTVRRPERNVEHEYNTGRSARMSESTIGARTSESTAANVGAPRRTNATPTEPPTQRARLHDGQLTRTGEPRGTAVRTGESNRPMRTDGHDATTQQPRRSTRTRYTVDRLTYHKTTIEEKIPIDGEIFCLPSVVAIDDETRRGPVHAMAASTNPDILMYHEAMKAPDKEEFVAALHKEWNDQLANGNFSVRKKSDVPEGVDLLPGVWAFRRKRDIRTRVVRKHKARWNVDGSKQIRGRHFDETYAPVAKWTTIRLILTLTSVLNWKSQQIDYVQAYPQAPVERDLWIKIPPGITLQEGRREDHVLQLHRNVYGQKQAGRVWYQYLRDKLVHDVGFTQSTIDPCLFYRGRSMYVVYTDDSILTGPDKDEIDQIISDIRKSKLDITIEGDIEDFLGINISQKDDGTVHLHQPHLVDQILTDLRLNNQHVGEKDTPAMTSKILHRHSDSVEFDRSFHYRGVIGKLGYLETGSRPDIAYIAHQCARFSTKPMREHGNAIRWLGRYLKKTKDKGLIFTPQLDRGLEVHVDADFAGNWDPDESDDVDTARSRHGYVISYAGCPVSWKSSLQSEIALSTTEAEYVGISYALREAIPIMRLLREMKKLGFNIINRKVPIRCKVFEDNAGAIEIAKTEKYRPRTKHMNIKLHHFRQYVTKGRIEIVKIESANQQADILTKPLPNPLFELLRRKIMGW